MSQFYPGWMELLLIALLLFSFWYPMAHYHDLPLRFPTHFGSGGEPDAWGTRNLVVVLLVPIIQAVMYLVITGISLYVALAENPKRVINASRKRLEAMSVERAETIRRVAIIYLFAVKALTIGLLSYMSYGQIKTALGEWPGLGMMVWVFLVAIMGVTGVMTWRLLALVYGREN